MPRSARLQSLVKRERDRHAEEKLNRQRDDQE